jgi:hypothetical protein
MNAGDGADTTPLREAPQARVTAKELRWLDGIEDFKSGLVI